VTNTSASIDGMPVLVTVNFHHLHTPAGRDVINGSWRTVSTSFTVTQNHRQETTLPEHNMHVIQTWRGHNEK